MPRAQTLRWSSQGDPQTTDPPSQNDGPTNMCHGQVHERHQVARPLDHKRRQASHAALHAMGTGPSPLVSRELGVRTVYRRNPHGWGRAEGNVQQIVYTPIVADAERTAALLRGQVDLVLDPAPRDVGRARLPFDLPRARQLMAEAGWAEGFEVTLDCPNNRTINDEEICHALAALWAPLKIRVRVNAMPRERDVPKLEQLDTSLFLMGWGGAVTDAVTLLTPVLRKRGSDGVSFYNHGNVRLDAADAMATATSVEPVPRQREALIKAALVACKTAVAVIPLHRQVIPWAMPGGVRVVHRPDNWPEADWISAGPR